VNRNAIILSSIIFLVVVAFLLYSVDIIGYNNFIQLAMHNTSYGVAIGIGYSMYPTIDNGSLVLYIKNPKNVKVGDIVIYDAELDPYHTPWVSRQDWFRPIVIAHRVIEIYPYGYLVKGDNNPIADPWIVKKSQILGKVVRWFNDPISKAVAEFWFRVFGY